MRKIIPITITILSISLLLTGCGNFLKKNSSAGAAANTTTTTETEVDEDKLYEEAINSMENTDEYFEENSKVLDTYTIDEADNIKTEAEVAENISDRNLGTETLIPIYGEDGTTVLQGEDETDTDIKSPMYQSTYVNSSDEIWSIIVIADRIYAYPMSYMAQSEDGVEVIVSEQESILSYDGVSGKFFETIPEKEVLRVMVVDEINQTVLDELTVDKLIEKVKKGE